MSPETKRRITEELTRIPGTASYSAPEGGLVGNKAIEADSIVGHDNLEEKTQLEQEGDEQGKTPEGSGSFEIPPRKLD